ncbi:uncharacterized protein LOC116191991 isoform X2 [Punica granatum]|uniref:Protein PSK SIMULATOR 1-like n=2 Tax=Punica granatum TaxID=22663 RepID=A0A218X8T1_PUNGR|nr:uncharacterized protein LOC116191991 isoform X2 [Punica granatum]OWM80921.1 hypothetical protein CDL15_Pgr006952 [Punica granatum]PKI45660.1 hypothetical protein CRG98_033976 [Punica granatum]
MGGVCSGGTPNQKREKGAVSRSAQSFQKPSKEASPASESKGSDYRKTPPKFDSGELRHLSFSRELKPSKPSTPTRKGSGKVSGKGSFLGRAGTVSLDRAVDVLDTLGSSVSNLNVSGGFGSGISSRGSRISILAFEVANTIVKGANLLQSLSEENIQVLKKEILQSEGVQLLVSTDMKALLTLAALDKREELDIFSREVIRFGDLCKDPQWHNLGRFFTRLDYEDMGQKQLRAEADATMLELSTLAQHTSELYHELHALDRFEQDYKQKLEEAESLNLPRKGECLTMLLSVVKQQRKLVRDLKKKSLWSQNLEEIVEKLVDIVTYIHQEISDVFQDSGSNSKGQICVPQRLGVMGLSLHYANVINLIDTIASRPAYLPPNTRDTLYHGLPPNVKNALRSSLQTNKSREELSMAKVKAEMEKTLEWLVPVATNTIKAHQGFGWVGEWANSGTEFGKSNPASTNVIRLQTLYHADKQKADRYILELVTWLHCLFNLVRHRDDNVIKPFPANQNSITSMRLRFHSDALPTPDVIIKAKGTELSEEDREMLNRACRRKLVPGISKSQEFPRDNRTRSRVFAISRSMGSSPNREFDTRRGSPYQEINVLDGLDPNTV